MNQILVSMNRTFLEYSRNWSIIISTLGIPLFFMIFLPYTIINIPEEVVEQVKGFMTISMISLLIMSACQSNLAGFIVGDKNRGYYQKILSMPVKLWKESLGRILAVWVFTMISILVLLCIGFLNGGRFDFKLDKVLISIGILLLIGITSMGIGLIIATVISNESAATHFGVALSLIIFFLGGMAIPYSDLPHQIQLIAQLHPISAANAMITSLLIGVEYAGYDPFTVGQILLTISSSMCLFLIGLILYSKMDLNG